MFRNLLIFALAIAAVSAHAGHLRSIKIIPGEFQLMVNHTNITNYLRGLDGFATTVGIYSEMPAFEACKDRDAQIVDAVVRIIEDVVSGDNGAVVDDTKLLIDTAYEIYKNCDFDGFKTQFIQMLSDIKSNFTQEDYMKKLVNNLQSKIFQIMADLKSIMDDMNAGNYENSGKNFGSLIRTIFYIKQA